MKTHFRCKFVQINCFTCFSTYDNHEDTYKILFKSLDRAECEKVLVEGIDEKPMKGKDVREIIKNVKTQILADFHVNQIKIEMEFRKQNGELEKVSQLFLVSRSYNLF